MPRRKPAQSLADHLDRKLLNLLRNGRKVLDQQNGVVVTVDPSAADLRAIVTRVQDIDAAAQSRPLTAPEKALKRAAVIKFNGRKIPPLDTERDDAATA